MYFGFRGRGESGENQQVLQKEKVDVEKLWWGCWQETDEVGIFYR